MARRRARGKRVKPLEALAALNRAVSGTEEYREARRRILAQFARMANGKPVLCQPPISEQRLGHIPGAFKVIYDTEDNARGAASELSRLGAPPLLPYDDCPFGEPHFHLQTIRKYREEKGA